jgi:hypothetical protein
MPASFHWLSVGVMFYAELVAPFLVFGPRPVRLIGLASLLLLQLLIAATGNYGFFNLLAIVLCLSLLDDRDWERAGRASLPASRLPGSSSAGASPFRLDGNVRARLFRAARVFRTQVDDPAPDDFAEPAPDDSKRSGAGERWSRPRRLAVGVAGSVLVAVTAAQTVESAWREAIVPSGLIMLGEWLEPLRSTNHYGLFAVMTTKRPEIIVEGSADGETWRPYRFRWKPCELDRRPRFTTPHMPRLDWQMWFAALAGDCRSAPWFLRFEERLLEGEPRVLGLLRENPFPAHPPRYVRARLYLYRFTQWGSEDWWARDDKGLYCPTLAKVGAE